MIDDQVLDDRRRRQLRRNWQQVVGEVSEHCDRCGRDATNLRIIGVTKYVDAATTAAVIAAGCRHVGENRPQVLWDKFEQIAESGVPQSTETENTSVVDQQVTWHLIGHLQRNKVRRLLRQDVLIHSIDSPRLLAAVAAEAESQNKTVRVLLEANISGEPSKTGMSPDDLRQLVDELASSTDQRPANEAQESVQVVGLMAMAGFHADSREAQSQFAATRELRDELAQRSGLELPELSMGMSRDFPEAIAEGATMLRIGTKLFATDSDPTSA